MTKSYLNNKSTANRPSERTVTLLTKSQKNGGYCVAGVDTNNGEFVRLMTSEKERPDAHGALFDEHMTYADGTPVRMFDTVRFTVSSYEPEAYQTENAVVDFSRGLELVSHGTLGDVLKSHRELAAKRDGHYHGIVCGRKVIFNNAFDTIDEKYANRFDYSLALVHATDITIRPRINSRGNKRAVADFTYNSFFRTHEKIHYENIRVTVPDYYNLSNEIHLDDAYLVMSVGLPYNGKIYKYVAGIYAA